MDRTYDVVVVGAGIAGLKAASVLTQSGKSCLVIESRDRIGGRLCTVTGYNGARYDLGASWHHDTLTNRLFAEEVQLAAVDGADSTPQMFSGGATHCSASSASSASTGGNSAGVYAPFVFDDDDPLIVDKIRGSLGDVTIRLIADEIEKFIELYFHSEYTAELSDDNDSQHSHEGFPRADMPLFDMLLMYLQQRAPFLTDDQMWYGIQYARYMELWHGVSWYQLSSRDSFFGHQGRNAFVMNYDTIYNRIHGQIRTELGTVQLNSTVTKIENAGAHTTVSYTTSSASGAEDTQHGQHGAAGQQHTVQCRYVIVTIPQSLLSEGAVEFKPPLVPQISAALQKMHFGSLGKVVFEFEECCWDLHTAKIVAVAHAAADTRAEFTALLRKESREKNYTAQRLQALVQDVKQLLGDDSVRHDCWNQPLLFVNMAKTTGVPSLMMLMAPPLTHYIESLHDSHQVYEFFKPVLSQIMSVCNAPGPIINGLNIAGGVAGGVANFSDKGPILRNVIVTDWTNDPYSKGAYSACYAGDDALDMFLAMSNGQSSQVRFAGEHTILDGAGCAYGAWESGEREANYILKQMK